MRIALLVLAVLASTPAAAGQVVSVAPGSAPLISIPVEEGDYRVTVHFSDAATADGATIKAESRRLMAEPGSGRGSSRTFVVNVRRPGLPSPPPKSPGGTAVRLNDREQGSFTWDDQLTLEVLGARATSVSIESVTVPRVFLLGDSTVTDQRFEPAASWGQMLTRFFRPEVSVANHAESGETLKSFLTGLRLDKVLSQVRPGDYALVQFGHNDSKAQWPQTYAPAETTYRSYLRTYVDELRRRGATPILVTSPHRRTFDTSGKITNSHGRYPDAVKAVGKELGVAVIDLNAMSADLYEALGPERAPLAFSDGGRDATHHNNYGAYELARAVAKGLHDSGSPLTRWLVGETERYEPAQPDPPERFHLAPSGARSDVRPQGS